MANISDKPLLQGKTLISTREARKANELQGFVEENGGKFVECPIIALKYIQNNSYLSLINLFFEKGGWLIFTSANAVRYFVKYLNKNNLSVPPTVKIAAISIKTAQKLKELNLTVDFIGKKGNGLSFSSELKEVFGKSCPLVVFVTGNLAPDTLKNQLNETCDFHRINIYETIIPDNIPENAKEKISSGNYDLIYIYSPSAINNLFEYFKNTIDFKKLKVACVGPTSEKACKALGIHPLFVADKPDTDSLFNATLKYFNK